jgi:hypothetical protein
MCPADKVTGSFIYVADKRPVLAFNSPGDALAFQKNFIGAEIYNNKKHVFLPTPHGLEFVSGGKNGETAYGTQIFITIDHFLSKLGSNLTNFVYSSLPLS